MGRYKRKRRKVLKTSTSPTTCEKIVTFVEVDKREKTKKVIKDFYNSLKKRNKFGNLIHDFHPLINFTEPTDSQMEIMLDNIIRGGRIITIGDKFTIFVQRWRHSSIFENYWGRLQLIDSVLYSRPIMMRTLGITEGLEYFLHDELDKIGKNKTTIPNNLAFMARFATIFGICGFLLTVGLVCMTFSPIVGFYYSLFSSFLMFVFKTSIEFK